MKEKILALLLASYSGVRKDGLAQLAGAMSLHATTEEEAKTIVEKLTADQVNDFIKDFRRSVDKEVSESNETYKDNLKKKFNLIEKGSDPEDDPNKQKTDASDDAPAWAKSMIDQNKILADRLNAFEGQKITETRLQMLEGKFSNVPDSYKNQRISDAKLFISSLDEEAFNEYLQKTESDITVFNQEMADKGLSGQVKPMFSQKDNNGVSTGVASFLESQKDNPLGGKEV